MQIPSDPFERWQTLLKYFHDNLRSGIERLVQVRTHAAFAIDRCTATPKQKVDVFNRALRGIAAPHRQR